MPREFDTADFICSIRPVVPVTVCSYQPPFIKSSWSEDGFGSFHYYDAVTINNFNYQQLQTNISNKKINQ